ncbi:uncharacterized protein LOC126654996 isoform X1 [Mercurialis annua]|uniref:uncharacterized protein LOC126654996 isoform X1 n=1 Tax=Mercurialis annua TaxID=3986 RepID=UPI00215EBE25|nr:uncharacterized protein LOC126654996 isoform X1 [Mercurialis annua]
MRELWNKWRGWMHFTYVKDKTPEEAMKTVPDGADKDDCEWLIKNHFYTEKFKKASQRNSKNRGNLTMPHRIGSKPMREIIYQMGGKDGNPPNIGTIFHETRKQIDKLIEPETIAKYDEICEVMQSDPSLSNVEVVLKCFRNQSHGHVVGYGGGVKLKHLKGPSTKKVEREAQLLEENQLLKNRLSTLEDKFQKFEKMFAAQEKNDLQSTSSHTTDTQQS